MRYLNNIIVLVTILVLTSCGVTRMNTAKTKDVSGPGVEHLPVLVDLDVKPTKVTGTATGTLKATVTKLSIKQEAIANALAKVNGDILIEPYFKTEGVGTSYTITVTGYPATYKDFRQMELKDTTLVFIATGTYESRKQERAANQRAANQRAAVKNGEVVQSKPKIVNKGSKGKPAPLQTQAQYEKYGKPGDRTQAQKKKVRGLFGKIVLVYFGVGVLITGIIIAIG